MLHLFTKKSGISEYTDTNSKSECLLKIFLINISQRKGKTLMSTLRVFLSTMRLQMKNSFVRPMYRFCLLAAPILSTVLIYHLFSNSRQENFATYVIMGAGLVSLWGCICFSSVGDINRERWSGTLSIIYTSPAKFNIIILAKTIGTTILAYVSLIITFLTAIILYQAEINIANIGYFILSLFVLTITFVVISIIFAYILLLSRKTALLMNCLEYPMLLLCGFTIPISALPLWVQYISYCLAPTWGVTLLRMSIDGIDKAAYWHTFGICVAMIIVYSLIIFVLYKVIDKTIRRNATLELM